MSQPFPKALASTQSLALPVKEKPNLPHACTGLNIPSQSRHICYKPTHQTPTCPSPTTHTAPVSSQNKHNAVASHRTNLLNLNSNSLAASITCISLMLQGCVHVSMAKQAVTVNTRCRPLVPGSARRWLLLAIPALQACMQHGCHNGCCHVACGRPDHAEVHHIDACQDARQLGNMTTRHQPHLHHSNTCAHTRSQVRTTSSEK